MIGILTGKWQFWLLFGQHGFAIGRSIYNNRQILECGSRLAIMIIPSPQWPPFHSSHPLYNGNGHYKVSPTVNNLLRTGSFSATDEIANNGHCKILITNIANLVCLATLTFWFPSLFKFFLCILSLNNYIYKCWVIIMGYSCKHELRTMIMLSFLKKICHILHPYRPCDGYLSTMATFFCP